MDSQDALWTSAGHWFAPRLALAIGIVLIVAVSTGLL